MPRKPVDSPSSAQELDQANRKARAQLEKTSERAALFTELMKQHAKSDEIKNGVKTGQETVSMQVRVLKEQADMLRAAAFVEGRPATAILRDLLKVYFEVKQADPDAGARERFRQAVDLMAGKATEAK